MIPDEAVEAAVEAFLKDDKSYCECRHSTLDKHDVNPRCSTRKRVAAQMASALEAAEPRMLAEVTALVSDLTDPDGCSYDHHGGCQAHGYLSLQPGEMCPQLEAKAWVHNHRPTP